MADGPAASIADRRQTRLGVAAGTLAYFIWGFVAIYFNWLNERGVNAEHLLAYRISWSTVFLAILMTAMGLWPQAMTALRSGGTIAALVGSTIMIAINWYTYIYSVATHQLSYASLGYYINPLVNVMLGVALLGERLRPMQLVAVLLAAAGVAFQTYAIGKLPWISLLLAVSFGFYGLLRKTMPLGAVAGLMVETALLAPLTLAFIAIQTANGRGPVIGGSTHAPSALSGIITAAPLLLFAAAARRLRLTTMGFLQFFSPTLQLVIAVLVFHEPFKADRMITFGFIWLAVLVFLGDQIIAGRRALPQPEPARFDS